MISIKIDSKELKRAIRTIVKFNYVSLLFFYLILFIIIKINETANTS